GIRTMLISGLGGNPGVETGSAAADEAPPNAAGDKQKPFSLGFISGIAQRAPDLAAGTVMVTAVDENGRPLGGKTVELGHVRAGGKVEVSTQVTDAEGVARFTGLGAPAAGAQAAAPSV